MTVAFPELKKDPEHIIKTIKVTSLSLFVYLKFHFISFISIFSFINVKLQTEEEAFSKTLEKGQRRFESIAEKVLKADQKIISADLIHLLYTTYGFPEDLTGILASEKGLQLDVEGFKQLMQLEKQGSRDAAGNKGNLLFIYYHIHFY